MVPPSRPTARRRWARRLRRLVTVTTNVLVLASIVVLLDGGASGAVPTTTPQLVAASTPAPSQAVALVSPSIVPTPGPTPSPAPTPGPMRPPQQWFFPAPSPTRPPPVVADPIPTVALQRQLDSVRRRYHLPGVEATIIWPDGRIWNAASGMANLASGTHVGVGTAFSIGSISKTFVAALILELAHEGRLSLDDTARHWLPTAKVGSTVTIREMLNHSSGLDDFFSNPKIDKALLGDRAARWTPGRALSYMRSPYCKPATCWAYSNSNYVLLGLIAEKVTGDPIADQLRTRFFKPLRMSRTFFQGVEKRRGPVATAYRLTGISASRLAYSLADGTTISPFTSVVTAAGSAGAIASTSHDLAIWARSLYTGKVLDPASLAAMLDTKASVKLHAPVPYGFAVSVMKIGGRLAYGHNGRFLGARASIRYYVESGFTVAVVTNQSLVGPDVFGKALMDVLLPPVPGATPGTPEAP